MAGGRASATAAWAAADTSADVVLRIGSAVAVLVDLVASGGDDGAGAKLAGAASEARAARDALAARALARATGRADIVIGRRPTGRPRLAPPCPELGVSLSARGPVLLAGFSPVGRVGVDLEALEGGTVADPQRMARDHFAPGEAAAVAALATAAARDLFLRLWVAKEAALKLTGRGVYDGLALPDLTGRIARLMSGGVIETRVGDADAVRIAVAARSTAVGPLLCALAVVGE